MPKEFNPIRFLVELVCTTEGERSNALNLAREEYEYSEHGFRVKLRQGLGYWTQEWEKAQTQSIGIEGVVPNSTEIAAIHKTGIPVHLGRQHLDLLGRLIETNSEYLEANSTFEVLDFQDQTTFEKSPFLNFKRAIEQEGFWSLNKMKIFNANLTYILRSENLKVHSTESNGEHTVNGMWFLQFFKRGYTEGVKYFDENLKVEPGVFYGPEADSLVRNWMRLIRSQRPNGEPLEAAITRSPLTFSTAMLVKKGFASGILAKMDDYEVLHREVFMKYGRPNKTASKFTNNFNDKTEEEIETHFRQMVKKKWLTENELQTFLKKAFELKQPTQPKHRLKNWRYKKDVETIFHSFYKNECGSPRGKSKEYLDLLKLHFVGFEKSSTSNWGK